ncbi:TonB-dependent receptor [Rhodanobacter sp. B2A1Ga4]|uniref:TonB-dependent receptor n=1 Tax=Rhodanobacter TaxID=75309 RepID=UPI00131F2B50|nr:TonB-dependent receptor [Rhodanobacter thiooxydans]MBQ4856373.1 TonB-dependent receptor [Rhodanobacter sp. B2A1Ga4]
MNHSVSSFLALLATTALVGASPAYAANESDAAQPTKTTVPPAKKKAETPNKPAKNIAELQAVTVTAEHRAVSINDTGITIDAFVGSDLREMGATKLTDIARYSPGINMHGPFGENGYPEITIRGMNADNFTELSPQSVGVYADGVYLSSPPLLGLRMFDLDRVEVLKGPQGTLYGRNTIGGAMNLISVRPTFYPDGYFTVDYGSYQYAAAEGAIGGPLSDKVAYRLSTRLVRQWSGPFSNSADGTKTGQLRQAYWRAQVLWNPTDALSVLVNFHGGTDRSDTWPFSQVAALVPPGQANAGQICPAFLAGNIGLANAQCVDVSGYHNTSNDPYRNPLSLHGRNHDKSAGFSTEINWDLDAVKLTSVTGYDWMTRRAGYDEDAGPNNIIDTVRGSDINQFSEELRLASNTKERLNWMTGLYYSHDRLSGNPIFVSDFTRWFGASIADYSTLRTSTWGAFGQIDYALTDELKLTAGLRDSGVRRQYDYREIFTPNGGAALTSFAGTSRMDQSQLSGKLGLDYKPNKNLLLYANVSRGFNAGTYSAYFISNPQSLEPTKSETAVTYEGGFKLTALQKRVQLNGAIYYNDWKGIQLTAVENRTGVNAPYLTNGKGADIYGGELELIARPTPFWDVTLGGAYLHTELRDLFVQDLFGNIVNIKGRPLANSPTRQFNASTRYRWDISGDYQLVPQMDVKWEDTIYRDLLGTRALISPPHMTANASVTLDNGPGKWHVQLWVHNLTDRRYVTEAYQVVSAGIAGLDWSMPRTFGVSFGMDL